MADNVVKIVFEGEAKGLFAEADKVSNRVRSVAKEAETLGNRTRAASVDANRLNNGFLNVAKSAQTASRDFQLSPKIVDARNETAKLGQAFKSLSTDMQPSVEQVGSFVAGLGPAGIAIAAVGAVAIGISKKLSDDYRRNAELRLKAEERIQGAINQEYIKRRDGLQLYEETLKKQEASFARADRQAQLEKLTNGILESRLKTLDQMARLNSGSPNIQNWTNEAEDIKAQLRKNRTADTGESVFNQSFAIRMRAMEADRQKRIEDQEAFNRKVVEGVAKVRTLGETWSVVSRSLAMQEGSGNPFVKVMFDAGESVDKLKEKIKGLPAELQNAMIRAQQTINARQLFGARVDSSLRAFDLREMASRFRDGDQVSSAKRLADAMRPDTDRAERELQKYRDAAARLRERGLPVTFAVNEQARQEYIDRRRRMEDSLGRQDASLAAQDRLDKQLGLLNNFRAKSVDEQSILDNKILGIAGGLNPDDLRGDQRNAIAAAAERQAEREARMQSEALTIYKQQLEVQGKILEAQNKFVEVATGKGIDGVNKLLVEIKNETGTNVKALEQPTPSDVSDYYGTFSGGGGLTSF